MLLHRNSCNNNNNLSMAERENLRKKLKFSTEQKNRQIDLINLNSLACSKCFHWAIASSCQPRQCNNM